MGSLPDLHALSVRAEAAAEAVAEKAVACLYPCRPGPLHHQHQPQPPQQQNQAVKLVRSIDRSICHVVDIGHHRLTHRSRTVQETSISTAHSPMSARSARSTTTLNQCHVMVPQAVPTNRHRDSMSSSTGASSVRRLIGVVRSTPSQHGPVYSRRVIHHNWAALCLANALLTSAIVPLLGLQSSISSWWWPPSEPNWFYMNADIGSLLLGFMFTIGSLSSLFMEAVIKWLGTTTTINISYGCALVFFTAHLYPKPFTLVPSYLAMGLSLGPLAGSRISALMALAAKYSCVLSDEEEDEIERAEEWSRRDAIVHKLARWMQTTQDCGVVVGNLLSGLVMYYTWSVATDAHDSSIVLDSMYAVDEAGERVCGAASCPVVIDLHSVLFSERSNSSDSLLVLPCKSCMFLASVFVGFGIMAWIVAALFTDRLIVYQDVSERNDFANSCRVIAETFKDPQLLLVVPLALCIGLTQGFMYADFTKSYVVCSLDLYSVTWVFVALGVLQCIAGCTVSLVLQQIKRIYVIFVGFTFHSCLLLVLLRWKPTGDDPALLYVIGAVWGVCNSIWESLIFSLLIAIYPDKWQPVIGHHYFFRYLGLALAFSVHGVFCNHIKLYMLAAALVLTTGSYAALEWWLGQGQPRRGLPTM